MYNFISNMLVVGKKNIQVFQKSILMQITSLKMLFADMKEKYNISYISTHKVIKTLKFFYIKIIYFIFILFQLNQDLLENFFSQLRQKGGTYDHPSRLHIILGKSPSIIKSITSTSESKNHTASDVYITSRDDVECQEQFVSASIFEEADIVPDVEEIVTENDIELTNDLNTQELDGLEYIIGYIARKFKDKYPNLQLGDYTCNAKEDHTYTQPQSFVDHVSVG
uniref:Uncharacterized protein n=1 Tax=Anopheles funestus TaxID=62324 RepID=A0A182RMF0_ANOFN